jgi:hypothetical protein
VCESECIRCERTRKKTKIADQEISENEEVGKISEDKKRRREVRREKESEIHQGIRQRLPCLKKKSE